MSTTFGEKVLASNWQAVLLDTRTGPRKIRIDDVDAFTRADVGEIMRRARDVDELIDMLERRKG